MRHMKQAAAAILLMGALMSPAGATAQTPSSTRDAPSRLGNPTGTARQLQDLFYGVVKSIEPKEVILEKTKFGIDQAIMLNEKTKYVRDGKASKFDDLRKGDQVWIRMKIDKKTGEMTAKVVMCGVIAPTIQK